MPFTVTQTNNRLILRDKFFGDISGLSNFQITLNGDSRAFGSFENDPFNLTSGIVLSTGRVIDLVGANTQDGGLTIQGLTDLSTDFGVPEAEDDSITLEINFDSDGSKDKIYFQYVFGSEEFLEFAGKDFNDSFSLSLNGQNLAILPGNGVDSDGNRVVSINNIAGSPVGPFARDPRYTGQNFLQYNSVAEGTVRDQTRLDGYTLPFTFEGDLNDGANTLIINVKDVNDGRYDSVVFLKADTFGTTRPADIVIPGLTPATSNAAPVAVDASVTVGQSAINLTGLSATDSDGSISSYAILTLPDPAQGTLFFGDPAVGGTPIIAGQPLPPTLINQLFFQPSANFTGSSFTYTATDDKGAEDTTPAKVTLNSILIQPPKPQPPEPEPPEPKPFQGCKPGKQIKGNRRNNKLEGTEDSDILWGKGGNDLLQGLGCSDALDGGRGNDRIFGGSDNDSLLGGRGDDQLEGGTGADTLKGGRNADILRGGGNDDRLYGQQNNDQLQGEDGNDILVGGLGRDHLLGGKGNDILIGRRGVDRLIGGTGSDRFVFDMKPPFNIVLRPDQIDFRSDDRDKIALSRRTFAALTSKEGEGFSKAAEFAVVKNDVQAASSKAIIIYSISSRQLFYNTNAASAGLGEGGVFAKLLKSQDISSVDFIIQS